MVCLELRETQAWGWWILSQPTSNYMRGVKQKSRGTGRVALHKGDGGDSARGDACCSEFRLRGRWADGLVVGDDLAGLGDVLLDEGDPVGPVASGFVGVGDAGGVFALGLGEVVEEDFEVLLGCGAGHSGILERAKEGCVLAGDRP